MKMFRVSIAAALAWIALATPGATAQTATEKLKQDTAHADRLTAYLKQSFPGEITGITIAGNQITIAGRLTGDSAGAMLAEVPMWQDVTDLHDPPTATPIAKIESGRFALTMDRHAADGRDRLLSAWAIVRKADEHWELLSSQHYIDEQKARAELPPARPKSIKGMGGCPFDHPDIKDLGICTVTLNIVLNEILSTHASNDAEQYEYAGRRWYVSRRALSHYDREMKAAAERELMVSAIILIAPARGAPGDSWVADAAHPDAEAGAMYTMPNFTTRAGVEAYAAVMNFLAERYSRPDGKYGRIHHWIMHNEVDSGFYWTNAGNKTLITYLELYQKSLRLTLLLSRQYDPNAKPLISLDHCWTRPAEARGYADRSMLERLVDFSRREGDFPWGIAFHPYAQDLFNPRTWEDSDVTFDFGTPFITFKNIEVLDAWARQPAVAYRGREVREIQLSEQGVNSRDYSDQALAEQAAGLAYAWKKIEPLKTVTAFQYHIWTDARSEGGLRLGIRKFSDDPADPSGKKPSWNVFAAMSTDQWDQTTAFARPMIGIKDWTDVRHSGQVK